jgi:NAD(P)-dependent dehydrogenase (short-subunit alcohol dehydrogenase family)
MIDLSGRGAIVVGTRRIGSTVVERLAHEGVRPAIVYRGSVEEAHALYEVAREEAGEACVIQADISVEADVIRAIDEAKLQLGDLSFCINLASDYPRAPLARLDGAAWDRGMQAARGAYLLTLHAGRAMMANQGPTRGHIIMFGDWAAGETPYQDYLPYLTAKAAVDCMTRAFAVEFAPYGILVNAICPGPTMAPPGLTAGEWQEALRLSPLRRESSEDDIAEMVVTLLRMETITGENIRIDSGRHVAGTGRPAGEGA